MSDLPPDDTVARNRFMIISMTRLIGAVAIMLGILVLTSTLAWPHIAGYALLAIGLIDTFIIPPFLAKKWGSKRG